MLFEIVNLRMAIMTRRDAICSFGFGYLFKFSAALITPLFRQTRLKKPTTPATAEIIGSIGCHVDKILFTHDGLDDETKVFRYGISK